MGELFDKLIDSYSEWSATADYYDKMPAVIRENNKETVAKLKYQFQDTLNDYIDKRIELANRK